jgi:putative sensory transduction regulator
MQTAKVLTEDELTPSNLKKFFESIYLNASLNDRGYLIVQADGMLPVNITLDQDRKLLKFLLAYDNGHGQLTLKHINRLNDSYILARFSVSEQGDSVYIDYHLPYEGGVTPYQLLSVLRIISRVGPAALHEEASDCVVPDRVLN